MADPTGYGPRRDPGSRWQRLCFNGDENEYELWETKFLGHLRMMKLKDTILGLNVPPEGEAGSGQPNVNDVVGKNEECYAELIQFLDDKSLSLVMRDAADDGRKALKILREHYSNQGKPRIITLYTELTSLKKGPNESITDYIIRAEKAITALRNAKEILSDGLLIAMILRGLPDSFKPFAIHITQSNDEITFTKFKSKLRSFEETEKFRVESHDKSDNVMKAGSTGTVPTGSRRIKGRLCQDGVITITVPHTVMKLAEDIIARTRQSKQRNRPKLEKKITHSHSRLATIQATYVKEEGQEP
ncbi:hypothetical protein BSL78_26554 [Apostichopus japonicus]|uniref:Uncharacterized protein n=1 Tax=Stichopus japonicus TaxID=307972 RepID=A0A2G8JLM3_STIJA|nr:hypothetical protein BSL78_26554 [Apostichopus japonicus]